MSVAARKIVIDTFDHWLDFESEPAKEVLVKVRDMILYRLETETIEMDPKKLGVRDEQVFAPDELVSFQEEEEREIDPSELIGPTGKEMGHSGQHLCLDGSCQKEEPIWEKPSAAVAFDLFEKDINK